MLPPPSRSSANTVPPWASTMSRTIASPRPEPGWLRDGDRPVEPVEDVRQIVDGDAGTVVADRQAATLHVDLDHTRWPRRGSAELGGVVDEVQHRAIERRRAGTTTIEASPTTVTSRPVRRRTRAAACSVNVGEIAVLGGLVVAPIRRQLDELVDQRRQLSSSRCRGRRPAVDALSGVEALETAQHRDVGAQAGQRRAQLVAGILHELVLLIAAAGQRAEHPVEGKPSRPASSEPLDGHRDVEPAGGGHIVGRLRSVAPDDGVTCRPISHPTIAARDDDERDTTTACDARITSRARSVSRASGRSAPRPPPSTGTVSMRNASPSTSRRAACRPR